MESGKSSQRHLSTSQSAKMLHLSTPYPLEKTAFDQFKPGKYLMSVQSPSNKTSKSLQTQTQKHLGILKTVSSEKTEKLPNLSSQRNLSNARKSSPDNPDYEKNVSVDRYNNNGGHRYNTESSQGFIHESGFPGIYHKTKESNSIEALQNRINELERQLTNTKNNFNTSFVMDFDLQNSLNLGFLDKEDSAKLKQILQGLIYKNYDMYKQINQRCSKLSALVNLLEYGANQGLSENDWSKIRITLEDLATTLVNASKTEIDLGIKTRELDRKNIEYVKLKTQMEKLHERCDYFESQCAELQKLKIELQEKLNSNIRLLEAEKTKNAENEKKVSMLEKRIELILECDISVDKDKLRKALTELVKENEGLKRSSFLKVKEIKRHKDDMSKMSHKLARQTKKIESLLRNKKGPTPSLGGAADEYDKASIKQDGKVEDAFNLLTHESLPYTLDFRTNSLRLQYAELLRDIMEQGSSAFLTQLGNLEKEKKEAINFVTSQLVSIKDFADKLHFFVREFLEMFMIRDVNEVMIFINKYFKSVFNSEQLNLWLADGISGIFYTINEQKQEIRCLTSKGIVSEIIKNGKPLNKRNMKSSYICELSMSPEKYTVDSTLIFPIKNSFGRTHGMLEISNITDSHYGYDEEYFGLALCKLITSLIKRIAIESNLLIEQKIRNMIFEAFFTFCESETERDLAKRIKEWTHKIFGISTSSFLFIENNMFIEYLLTNEVKKYELTMGIAGEVVRNKRSFIIMDTESSPDFNKLVDIVSVMPVYFIPIFRSSEDNFAASLSGNSIGEVVGLLQLIMKSKNQKPQEKITNADEMINLIGPDETTYTMVNNFARIISVSLNIFKKKRANIEEVHEVAAPPLNNINEVAS